MTRHKSSLTKSPIFKRLADPSVSPKHSERISRRERSVIGDAQRSQVTSRAIQCYRFADSVENMGPFQHVPQVFAIGGPSAIVTLTAFFLKMILSGHGVVVKVSFILSKASLPSSPGANLMSNSVMVRATTARISIMARFLPIQEYGPMHIYCS